MKKMNKQMNILLWILQVLFAVYFVIGGIYMLGHGKLVAKPSVFYNIPQQTWIILGLLQILFAVGLVLPAILKKQTKLIVISAIALGVLSLLGAVLYAAYSGTGVLWALIPAIVLAFIAYKRR